MPFKDPQKAKEYRKERYRKNKKKMLDWQKEYYLNHKEENYERGKKWLKNNKDKAHASTKRWMQSEVGKEKTKACHERYKNDPVLKQKMKARFAVRNAVRRKALIKPTKCSKCGKVGVIQAHHYNGYEKENYLKIKWICVSCHIKEHYVL